MSKSQVAYSSPNNDIQVQIHPTSDPAHNSNKNQSSQSHQNHTPSRPSSGASGSIAGKCCFVHRFFERSGPCFFNARYDASSLEQIYWESATPTTLYRIRAANAFLILVGIVWLIYLIATGKYSIFNLILFAITAILAGIVFGITFFKINRLYYELIGFVTFSILAVGLLIQHILFPNPTSLSPSEIFGLFIAALMILYMLLPLVYYRAFGLGAIASIAFEVLYAVFAHPPPLTIVARVLLHLAVHAIGSQLHLVREARSRSTFWRIIEGVMTRAELERGREQQRHMITSLMPAKVAEEVLATYNERAERRDTGPAADHSEPPAAAADEDTNKDSPTKHKKHEKGELRFRTFTVSKMSPVSVLFADIVGFTKMSSNKTATHLVFLLNDLFARFDNICERSGCEKIATLGDCYYCVSGCPEKRVDHAICCVKMGLGMCQAIQDFDVQHKESVNMRVGVHTGDILCGIVGSRRFKFDVFSNDVTLANMMESSGFPGRVHISEPTRVFLNDQYELENGPDVQDIRPTKVLIEYYNKEDKSYSMKHVQEERMLKTYFVICEKGETPPADMPRIEYPSTPDAGHAASHDDHSHDQKKGPEEIAKLEPLPAPQAGDSPSGAEPSSSITPSTAVPLAEHVGEEKAPLLGTSGGNVALAVGDGAGAGAAAAKHDPNAPSGANLLEDVSQSDALVKQLRLQLQKEHNKSLFAAPPVNKLSLRFTDFEVEKQYWLHFFDGLSPPSAAAASGATGALSTTQHSTSNNDSPRSSFDLGAHARRMTYASPRLTVLFDALASFFLLVCVALVLFIGFGSAHRVPIAWLVVCPIALAIALAGLFKAYLLNACPVLFVTFKRIANVLLYWHVRNVLGTVFLSLPAIAVFANFQCAYLSHAEYSFSSLLLCYAFFVSLLNYLNLTWYFSFWVRSAVATLVSALYVALFVANLCGDPRAPAAFVASTAPVALGNASVTLQVTTSLSLSFSTLAPGESSPPTLLGAQTLSLLHFEIIPSLVLLLVLVWFWNRESSLANRLSFFCTYSTQQDLLRKQRDQEQSDWLLKNIIPDYITEELRETQRYSRNLKNVGVIFASISNFYDFYEEQFEGGREFLRVLNELFMDFEELFNEPKYKDVEKIKTIGACFMGASGLNMESRQKNKDPNAHLYALMDFAQDIFQKMRDFNSNMLSFEFHLKIGYNIGEVTAGVIGTTKLLYDIWGDTVNVASRMYSTGIPGRIQVTEDTARRLATHYDFTHRGTVFVKGKGDMKTYLLVKRKAGAPRWDA